MAEKSTPKPPPPQPMSGPPLPILLAMSFAAVVAVLGLLALMPTEIQLPALVLVLVVVGLGAGARFSPAWGWLKAARADYAPPTDFTGLRAVPLTVVAAEIGLVLVMTTVATRAFWVPNPATYVGGWEGQWLTSSAFTATETLWEHGYIPLWEPDLHKGQPLIDNPFAFVLNPFSTGPSLLLGDAVVGIKLSVVAHGFIAALGGWFLARMLGLGPTARLLLAMMLLGKGNMTAMIFEGFFQLGVTQAYMPWILGAAVALYRLPTARWPVVMLALSFTLQFYGGNIWYTLPMIMSVGGLALAWSVWRDVNGAWQIDRHAIQRLALAAALTLGLSAAVFLPIFWHRGSIGGHIPWEDAGRVVNIWAVLEQFFDTNGVSYLWQRAPGRRHFFYSFVTPLWFALAIFIIVPPVHPALGRSRMRGIGRLWILGVVLLFLFTTWGIGGLQPWRFLYGTVPGLSRWRFVGRALGAASFWLAILVAVRVDGLFTALTNRDGQRFALGRVGQVGAVVLGVATFYAGMLSFYAWEPWHNFRNIDDGLSASDDCVRFLAEAYAPDEPGLAVYQFGYIDARTFVVNDVRLYPIEADYYPYPFDYNIYEDPRLIWYAMPQFAIPLTHDQRDFLITAHGYRHVAGSPPGQIDDEPCLMEKSDALPYAWTMSPNQEARVYDTMTNDIVRPATVVRRLPDQIAILAQPNPNRDTLLTVQETAYPGWRVTLDGRPATVESFEGQIGVTIPPGPQPIAVIFGYRPALFFVGAAITLLAALGCGVYLLLPGGLFRGKARANDD